MLYRILLISVFALGLNACFWKDYKKSSTGAVTAAAENKNETFPDTGVVANGNLEDSESEATGWKGYADTGVAAFGLSTAQYYTGTHSFKASVTSVGANPWEIGAGPIGISVKAGYTYYYSIWVLGTNGSTANFVAQLEEAPWTTLGSKQVNLTSSWQKVTFNFVVPSGVTSIQIPAQIGYPQNVNADMYFDQAALKGVAPSGTEIDIPIAEGLAGWSPDQAKNTLSYDPSLGLVINPNWTADDQVAMYTLSSPMDISGITLHYVINIPQEYIDAGISIQPYVQQVGGSYDGEWSGYVGVSDLHEGTNFIDYSPAGPPTVIQRIAFQIKGGGRSASPTSKMSIQRIYYALDDAGSDLSLKEGWNASGGGAPAYTAAGVSYSPTAEDHALTTVINGPENLEGATLVYTIAVDQAYKDSGANLQPIAQQNFGSYVGEWGCWINNSALTIEGAKHRCKLDGDNAPFNFADGQSIKVGVQAKGSPAGTVTISDVQIEYPGLPVDAGWRTSTGAPSYDNGVVYSPKADGDQLLFDVNGPDTLEGATFVFTIEASQEYIDTSSNLQPFAQVKVGTWPGEWSCWINNSDLKTTGAEHSCVLQAAEFDLADGTGMQIGVQAKGSAFAGTIKITNVRIIYAK